MKYEKLSSVLKYIFIDVCKIDQSKYYLLGSFALREHRKINDLDINLDKDEFFNRSFYEKPYHWLSKQ